MRFVWNYQGHNGSFFDRGPNWIQFTFPPSREKRRVAIIITSEFLRARYKGFVTEMIMRIAVMIAWMTLVVFVGLYIGELRSECLKRDMPGLFIECKMVLVK